MIADAVADQPKIENRMRVKAEGAKSTVSTDSWIVRPLEVPAMRIPMNGVQVTVHGQWNTVQFPCQRQPASLVYSDMASCQNESGTSL